MSQEAKRYAPKAWITGLGFSCGKYLTQSAQAVIAGVLRTGFMRKGLADGFLWIAPVGDPVPSQVRQTVLAVAEDFKVWRIDQFKGPIKDQKGVVRIPVGETWGNEKMGDFDWLVEGIIREPQ